MVDKPDKVDMVALGQAFRRRREQDGLSLRDVEDLVKVSASTLSRLENGIGRLDTNNLFNIVTWLGAPPERFVGDAQARVVFYATEPTPEIIREILARDSSLSERSAAILGDVVDAMYKGLSYPNARQRP